jgi:hypothetical protein
MQAKLIHILIFISCFLWNACSKNSSYNEPYILPPVCRQLDFSYSHGLEDICGGADRHYHNYRNIPLQRFLVRPKDAVMVVTSKGIELRIPHTHPIVIQAHYTDSIGFSHELMGKFIRNSFDYAESSSDLHGRFRVFRIILPYHEQKGSLELCFRIPARKENPRVRSILGYSVDDIPCTEFMEYFKKVNYAQYPDSGF